MVLLENLIPWGSSVSPTILKSLHNNANFSSKGSNQSQHSILIGTSLLVTFLIAKPITIRQEKEGSTLVL